MNLGYFVLFLLLLSSCSTEKSLDDYYTQDAETGLKIEAYIAQDAQLIESVDVESDSNKMRSKGYVLIGRLTFPGSDIQKAKDLCVIQANMVKASQAYFYVKKEKKIIKKHDPFRKQTPMSKKRNVVQTDEKYTAYFWAKKIN